MLAQTRAVRTWHDFICVAALCGFVLRRAGVQACEDAGAKMRGRSARLPGLVCAALCTPSGRPRSQRAPSSPLLPERGER